MSSRSGGTARRKSIDERAEEILERNRAFPIQQDLTVSGKSEFELAYKDLMDGLESKSPLVESGILAKSTDSLKSPSQLVDSFELSPADFEVGVIAATRLKEKTADRGRRMSFDQEIYQNKDRLRLTNSPDVKKNRRASTSNYDSTRVSTALSSIPLSQELAPSDFANMGSVAPSDNEFYNMLDFSSMDKATANSTNSGLHEVDHDISDTKEPEYDDDFEADINSSVEPQWRIEVETELKNRRPELSTVDQIMQRWNPSDNVEKTQTIVPEVRKNWKIESIDDIPVSNNAELQFDGPGKPTYSSQLIAAFADAASLVTSIPAVKQTEFNSEVIPSWVHHPPGRKFELLGTPKDISVADSRDNNVPILNSKKMEGSIVDNACEPLDNAVEWEATEGENILPSECSQPPDELSPPEDQNSRLEQIVSKQLAHGGTASLNEWVPLDTPGLAALTKRSLSEKFAKRKVPRSLAKGQKVDNKVFVPENNSALNLLVLKTVEQSIAQLHSEDTNDGGELISNEIRSVMSNLLQVSSSLHNKERGLKLKDQALFIREAVIDARERNLQIRDEKMWLELQAKLEQLMKEKINLEEKLQVANSQVTEYCLEINRLKSSFFQNSLVQGAAVNSTMLEANGADFPDVGSFTFEQLKNEYILQEKLILSYQKENERMSMLLKEQELRINSKQAMFFDQQQEMARELNRLRNASMGGSETYAPTKKKSSEGLLAELQQDGKVRYLQEKLSELEVRMVQRENAFIVTINRYKAECSELTNIIKDLRNAQPTDYEAELQKHLSEIQMLRDRVAALRNCQIRLEETEKKLLFKQQQLNRMRKDFISSGFQIEDLNQFFNGKKPVAFLLSRIPDSLMIETQRWKESKNVHKIRELESYVAQLTKALKDREANSIVSLVRAAKDDDPNLSSQNAQLRREITALQEELQLQNQHHEIHIRDLRTEHERLVGKFMQNVTDLSQQIRILSSNKQDDARDVNPTVLDDELNKIRTFYCRKIEQLQNRYERQLRSYKRDGGGENEDNSNLKRALSLEKDRVQRLEEKLLASASLLNVMTETSERRDISLDSKCVQTDDLILPVRNTIEEGPISSMLSVSCQTSFSFDPLTSFHQKSIDTQRLYSSLPTGIMGLERKITELERKLDEREVMFNQAVQQMKISAQIDRQTLLNNFKMFHNLPVQEIFEKDRKIYDFEIQLLHLLDQLNYLKQNSE